jgi:hypothetical protein
MTENRKRQKCTALCANYFFAAIAIAASGVLDDHASDVIHQTGRRITVMNNHRERGAAEYFFLKASQCYRSARRGPANCSCDGFNNILFIGEF